jgi:hypothetical protein
MNKSGHVKLKHNASRWGRELSKEDSEDHA